jgi:hypothetical protein
LTSTIYNLKEEQIGTSLHRMDLTTQHLSNGFSSCYFDATILSTITLDDIKSSSPTNSNSASFLTAFKDEESKYLPLLTCLKPPGFSFQVLAFNKYGAAHQHVHDILFEFQNKATPAFHTPLL